MTERILLVEDDPQITEVIRDYFVGHKEPYDIECASDGLTGMELIRKNEYDLILLDIMLPGKNGFSILREIRRTKDMPVIIITAKVREADRLLGYELGCDDYVCKPFSLAELYAKVGAVLRRFKASKEQEGNMEAGSRRRVRSCGKISIDRQSLDVTVDGKKLELSPKELDLLLTFISHPNLVYSRDMLLDIVWGADYDGTDRTVDNHVKKLRKSLGGAGSQIKTVYAKGYKMVKE